MEKEPDATEATKVLTRVRELLTLTGGAMLTTRQVASLLDAEEDAIVRELWRCPDIWYNSSKRVIALNAGMGTAKPERASVPEEVMGYALSDTAAQKATRATRPAAGDGVPASHALPSRARIPDAALDSWYSGAWRGASYHSDSVGGLPRRRGAVRKPRYRGALEEQEVLRGRQVGRVGYVSVADEIDLGALESYYRSQGYFTKFDFDVLHIRFAEKKGAAEEGGSGGYGTTSSVSASPVAAHLPGPLGGIGVSETESGSGHAAPPTTSVSAVAKAATEFPLPDSRSVSTPTGSMLPSLSRRAGFDLFVFAYGAVVWWGFDQRYFKIVENDFMLPRSTISTWMTNRHSTQLVNENYPVWCTYNLVRKETLEADDDFKERLRFDHFSIPYAQDDVQTCSISMLCASHALAQSAKIDYMEIKVHELTESCSPLPRELREHGRVTIKERRLLQLRGEVLSYRLMLKSGSDLLDEPDFFWENAYLKPLFQATKECFEIGERVEALDNKLDAANEILAMLADEFSQRHGARLEWIVIWLVFVEVIIGVLELLVDVRPWLTVR